MDSTDALSRSRYIASGGLIVYFFRFHPQVEPSHWFLRWMAKMTCFRPMTVLLGVWTMSYLDVMWKICPQNSPESGVNMQFQTKTPKFIHRNVSGTINLTNKRFEDRGQTTKGTRGWSAITPKQIQHGWRPPWKSIWRHITALGGPIWTKFGSLVVCFFPNRK